ncbi:MAG: acyl-CoA dehydrogenase family protein [Gammaproteobacteria bacterium]|nr:acyl-CoA dehydrogenase family protein [Gammaproteobacteria bacterium]
MSTVAQTRAASSDPLARADALGEVIALAADEIERTCTIPEPLLTRLHQARMMRLLLPRSLGGEELAPMLYARVLERLARHDASVAWNVFVGNSSALIAPYLEPLAARTIFSDPRAVVSWGPPNACQARVEDGGYRVSGEWQFASGCRQATWMGVHTPVLESDGGVRQVDGRTHIRTLLFPVEKARLLYDWNPIGLRGTGSDSYRVDEVFVPEAFSSTREDPLLCREPGPLYRFTMQGLYAVGVAGVALGIARRMLDEFIELAARKTPRGLSRLADSATVQDGLARREAALAAARAWLITVLEEIYTQVPEPRPGEAGAGAGVARPIDVADRARVRLACIQTISESIAAADWVYKSAGVSAIFPGSVFERRFRDMHTLSQQIQSRDAHYSSVGQVLLGSPPAVFY